MHLHAITLVVPDYDAGIPFYAGKLGFTLTQDTALSETERWVLVTPPGGQTHLLLAKADGPEQAVVIGNQTGGRVGFFLHTDDFDRDCAAIKTAGVTFYKDPRTEPYGKVVVWEDPFGNHWDLLELKA